MALFDLLRRAGQLDVGERSRLSRSERIAQRLREEQGIETQWLNDDEIRQLEPSLAPIYSRGLFFPNNGQLLNPHRLVQTLADVLRERGGAVERGEAVDIRPTEAGPATVHLEDGRSFAARQSTRLNSRH